MRVLAGHGIYTGITMMPILPFIEDSVENIKAIAEKAYDCGASYIIPWFGMSLRDRQRAFYYAQLDRLFPGMRERYEAAFGDDYYCNSPYADRLAEVFGQECRRFGITTQIMPFAPQAVKQLKLF
jgi:DNA repair photolyase